MRSEQLEYIVTVARLGSFRRAAQELHLSQPALSATVRNLEQELGVDILQRGRSGTSVSEQGRDLLPHIIGAIEAIDRLRQAADEKHRVIRVVRVGTVNAATVTLLTSVMRRFRATHEQTEVQIISAQGSEIQNALREGSLDLGLLNYLDGDDLPPDLDSTALLRGPAVVVMAPDSPLAAFEAVSVSRLLTEPMVLMRSGYLMHRYVHRLLAGRAPAVSYSTDGAEMGKLMVAEGLGVCVLPSFSVIGDPLLRHKAITWRPLADDATEVVMVLQRRRSGAQPLTVQGLHRLFVEIAATLPASSIPARPAA
jgi:DNA-binding transcriptional LysR family regulator